MSDTINEPVTIKLTDGVERNLRYSLGSCRRLKQKFGASVFSGDGLKGLDEDKLPALVLEGLCDEEGNMPTDLTEDKVANMISMPMLPSLMEAFVRAWAASNKPKNAESSLISAAANLPTVN